MTKCKCLQQICGESNISVMEAAAAAGVPRFVFVSVHDYSLPGGRLLHICWPSLHLNGNLG